MTTAALTSSPSFLTRLHRMVSPRTRRPSQLSIPHQSLPTPSSSSSSSAREFERVFHYFDENGDGKISPIELRNCMRASGEELSPEDAEDIVRSSDSDGDGLLGLSDFVRMVGGDEEEEEKGRSLRAAFGAYEMEGRGCITPKSLRRAFRRLGESKSMGECREMIRRFDLNGDGVISFDEFRFMML